MSDSCKICKFPTEDVIGVCSDHACMRQYIVELEAERDKWFMKYTLELKNRMLAQHVCKQADDYLNTNSLTNIGHGSILHRMFQDVIAKAKESETVIRTTSSYNQYTPSRKNGE